MGISGLLPLLKKASKNCHVRKFSGSSVAIDAFGWLHKGAFGCAAQLGKGEATTAYVTYCLKYINVLIAHQVKPVLVFDGRNLPAKAVTDNKRRQKREENRKQAQKCLREGKNKEAWECFTRCVEITPAMTRELIKVLRQQHIDYIIAPYEADAQLAYLSRQGIVDIVITEDSDLVLFGCSKIFFKMNVNGDGVLFDSSKLPACMGIPPTKFNLEDLRRMCILSGCDYLPSLPGIGLGKAKKVFMPPSSSDIRTVLNSVPQITQMNITVPEEYILAFIEADNTFLYQLAFDPISRTLVPLTAYPDGVNPKELTYAGAYVDKSLALEMALGNVDVKTQERVDHFNPCLKSGYTETSIWSKSYKIPDKSRLLLSDDKTQRKKSSGTGLKFSRYVSSSLKKRQIDCQDNEEKEEDILALYKNEGENEEEGSESQSKRIRLQDSDEDEKVDEPLNIANWSHERVLRSSARSNPFIKSPDQTVKIISTLSDGKIIETKLTASPSKNPKQHKENDNIVVQSKYFRSSESLKSPINSKIEKVESQSLSPSVMTRSFYKKSQNAGESENVRHTKEVSAPLSSDDDDIEFIQSSESSSYFSSHSSVNSQPPLELKSPVVSLNRLTESFGSLRSTTPKLQPINNKSSSSYSCRRVGLSKSLRNASGKRDPNQKSLMQMFSAQPKSKI